MDAATALVVPAVIEVADRLADHRAQRRNGGAPSVPSVPGGFRGPDTTLRLRSRYSAVMSGFFAAVRRNRAESARFAGFRARYRTRSGLSWSGWRHLEQQLESLSHR